ncbi:MAG: Flp family type IVb pilin [Devosia sp.]|nr:Flp family type IVb pilin [Devosia sp.]
MRRLLRKLATNENGATAIEYGLIAALVALLMLVGFSAFGSSLGGLFNRTADKAASVWNSAGG